MKFDTDAETAGKPEFAEYAKNVCLQIAAGTPPTYVNKEDVPDDVLAEEKEILVAQLKNDEKNANKPDAILRKIVDGRIGTIYERACLNEQKYVKEDSITVGQYTAQVQTELGAAIKVDSFVLYD